MNEKKIIFPNFEEKEAELKKENLIDFIEKIKKEDVEAVKKIKHFQFSDDFKAIKSLLNLSFSDENETLNFLVEKAKNDIFFANFFSKSPSRQSYHEKLVLNFLKSIPFIFEPKKLNVDGKESFFVINGIVQKGTRSVSRSKSIDFSFKYISSDNQELVFWMNHKYTKGFGGTQDNQFNDVKSFLAECTQNKNKDVVFVALCDGDFYQKRNKLEDLKDVYEKSKVRVSNSNDLPKEIVFCIKTWLEEKGKKDELEEFSLKYKVFLNI